MGFGDCRGANGGESRRDVGAGQSAAYRGPQSADGDYRQGIAAGGVRRAGPQEAEVFELCADCVHLGENRRPGGGAVSADRSGGGRAEEEESSADVFDVHKPEAATTFCVSEVFGESVAGSVWICGDTGAVGAADAEA